MSAAILPPRSYKSHAYAAPQVAATAAPPSPGPVITDSATGKRYLKGKFLGKGGFAKVYEMKDLTTMEIFAGKVVSKASLAKTKAKQKLLSEIKIHRSLQHAHVVGFERFFEDKDHVYILLEMCTNKSFMEMMKVRRRLTEPETLYFMRQLLDATLFMHGKNVIHRDLKLGNLFINKDLQLKVGDFGLATTVEHSGQRKQTICGTPNYIAPEILDGRGRGHSFEVDIWSIGVILYTFLIGRPPFETMDVKSTYRKIKDNDYKFPSSVTISDAAKSLIRSILNSNPEARPGVRDILNHRFFSSNRIPTSLPASCMATAPLPEELTYSPSKATTAVLMPSTTTNAIGGGAGAAAAAPIGFISTGLPSALSQKENQFSPNHVMPLSTKDRKTTAPAVVGSRKREASPPRSAAATVVAPLPSAPVAYPPVAAATSAPSGPVVPIEDEDDHANLNSMHRFLSTCFQSMTNVGETNRAATESTLPDSTAWVVKWVDYSNKYGLGYQLSDGTIGVFFNDSTKIALSPRCSNVEYVDRRKIASGIAQDERTNHTMEVFPDSLQKKMTLLKYFKNYLMEHLERGPAEPQSASGPGPVDGMVYVRKWLRTKHAIIFRLSNKTVQVNFFDHTKLILSNDAHYVTYVDKARKTATYSMQAVMENPATELVNRLKYAKDILNHLLSKHKGAAPPSPVDVEAPAN